MSLSLWCLILVQVISWTILIRNNKVYAFRRSLIQGISTIVRAEIRYAYIIEYERVSYEDMVWQFWRPLRSFYSKELLKLLD